MQVTVGQKQSLLEAMRQQNIRINAPCNGNGTCGGCMVFVQGFGKVRACKFRIPGTYEVQQPVLPRYEIVGQDDTLLESVCRYGTRVDWDAGYVVAVDVGTTTVCLTGAYQGKSLSVGFENPQRQFGADVITRIKSACEGNGKALSDCLQKALLDAVEDIRLRLEAPKEMGMLLISANTAMQHMLWNWDCSGLATAPFVPVSINWMDVNWKNMQVINLPGISAFVGSDVVSGIFRLGMHRQKEPVLLIDLGTNGEMALGCKEKLLVTSTAAGPAFEGSEPARKIHAAGILRTLHFLREKELLSVEGLLAESYFEKGYPVNADGLFESDAVITQEDIRDLQMAKAAIRAGIQVLLERYGITESQVTRVYLAGGMGYYIDPEDAFAVGLLPEEFRGRVMAVGNTSLAGALRCAREGLDIAHKELESICTNSREVVLADDIDFSDMYVEYMNF